MSMWKVRLRPDLRRFTKASREGPKPLQARSASPRSKFKIESVLLKGAVLAKRYTCEIVSYDTGDDKLAVPGV